MPYKDKEKRVAYAKAYGAEWYQKNREQVIERKKQRQLEILNWFRIYKSSLKCVNCGISHPAVLGFYHRNPENKSFTISSVVSRSGSMKKITEEIEKCDVMCANCYAKLRWEETIGPG